MDKPLDWQKTVRRRLLVWSAWSNGIHDIRREESPLARMIRKRAGDSPGRDLSVPADLTPELEAVEKSLARMRNLYPIPRGLLLDYYLRGRFTHEIAMRRRWSEEKAKRELTLAEAIVGRFMLEVDRELLTLGPDRHNLVVV